MKNWRSLILRTLAGLITGAALLPAPTASGAEASFIPIPSLATNREAARQIVEERFGDSGKLTPFQQLARDLMKDPELLKQLSEMDLSRADQQRLAEMAKK